MNDNTSARSVADAGAAAGYWTAAPVNPEHDMWVTVTDPTGLAFSIGTWANQPKVQMGVARLISRGEDGQARLEVHASDVRDAPNVDASCSKTRAPADIARELHKRVVRNEAARKLATDMQRVLAERVAQRAELLRLIGEAAKLGYRTSQHSGSLSYSTYWSVTLHGGGQGAPSIELSANGTFRPQHLNSLSFDRLALLLALIDERPGLADRVAACLDSMVSA